MSLINSRCYGVIPTDQEFNIWLLSLTGVEVTNYIYSNNWITCSSSIVFKSLIVVIKYRDTGLRLRTHTTDGSCRKRKKNKTGANSSSQCSFTQQDFQNVPLFTVFCIITQIN